MALTNCNECGREVSSQANTCPHCGVKKPTARSASTIKTSCTKCNQEVLMGDTKCPNCGIWWPAASIKLKIVLVIIGIFVFLMMTRGCRHDLAEAADKRERRDMNAKMIRETSSHPKINVTMSVTVDDVDGQTIVGTTNLPDGTSIGIDLFLKAYVGSGGQVTVTNGKFTFNSVAAGGAALMPGDYKITVTTPMQELQPPAIWPMLGKNGSNLTGAFVKKDPTFGNTVEYKGVIKIPVVETFDAVLVKARAGDAASQNRVGYLYDIGRGVAEDDKQAVSWYTKAAEQGLAKAQYNLAQKYRLGQGVEQDDKQAVSWYTKAAGQGYASAQRSLGVMYHTGKGVTKDFKQAVDWFTKAAEQGDADAQYKMGAAYFIGEGVTQDHKLAVKWFTMAAKQGHVQAQQALDEISRQDAGIEKNADTPSNTKSNQDLQDAGIKIVLGLLFLGLPVVLVLHHQGMSYRNASVVALLGVLTLFGLAKCDSGEKEKESSDPQEQVKADAFELCLDYVRVNQPTAQIRLAGDYTMLPILDPSGKWGTAVEWTAKNAFNATVRNQTICSVDAAGQNVLGVTTQTLGFE